MEAPYILHALPTSECCFSLPVRISSITLWITSLEIGLVIDVDYHFGNWLGIGLVIAPWITKIVTELEIRTAITRMVIGGNQTSSQIVVNFLSQLHNRLCHCISDVMDYFLAGNNQPNDLAGGLPLLVTCN